MAKDAPMLFAAMRSHRTPGEWADESNRKVDLAQRQAEVARQRRREVGRLENAMDDRWRNRDHEVESAFKAKMSDTQALHKMLEENIRLIDNNNQELRRVEGELEQAVAQKMEKLAVTESCMRTRMQRPTQEKVRDDVETLLEEEYTGLEQAIGELKQAKRKVQEQQRRFQALKQQLQLG